MLDRLPWLLTSGAALLAAWLGWQAQQCRIDMQALRVDQERQRAAAAMAYAERLRAAQHAADAAVTAAQQREAQATAQTRSLRLALDHVTSRTRPALSAAAARLLDQHPAFAPSAGLPARASSATQPAAAAASHPLGLAASAASSEHAIAQWGLDVASLYAQCRSRLSAIRDWDASAHPPAHR